MSVFDDVVGWFRRQLQPAEDPFTLEGQVVSHCTQPVLCTSEKEGAVAGSAVQVTSNAVRVVSTRALTLRSDYIVRADENKTGDPFAFRARATHIHEIARDQEPSLYEVTLVFVENENSSRDAWVKTLLTKAGPPKSKEKRVVCNLPFRYTTPALHQGSGRILNLSRNGFVAHVDVLLGVNTQIRIEVPGEPFNGLLGTLKGEVIHTKSVGQDNMAGVKLLEVSHDARANLDKAIEALLKAQKQARVN